MNAKPAQRAEATSLLRAEPWLSDREVARRVGLGNKTVSRLRADLGVPRGITQGRVGPGDGVPATELVVSGGASERKLRRWHTDGLMPEPRRYWVGRRRVALYAPRDVERVRVVAELMERYRSVDRVALGLLALGHTPSEQALRRAYDRFVARLSDSFAPLDAVFTALRRTRRGAPPELDAAVGWLATLIRNPRMEWARRLGTIHESDGVPPPDATLQYLENVSAIYARGSMGSDAAVAGFLADYSARMEAVMPGATPFNDMPLAEQVAKTKVLQRATRVSTLRRVAADAPLEELVSACDEVVTIVVGYIVMMDSTPYLGDGDPAPPRMLLCEALSIDPSVLAHFALLVASFKRDPDAGDELASVIANLAECVGFLADFALARTDGRLPALDAFARRYLGSRAGRASSDAHVEPLAH